MSNCTSLQDRVAELARQIQAARAELNRALIEGGDTSAVRERLTALQRAEITARQQLAAAEEGQKAQEAQLLSQRAHTIATSATSRLDDLLARLAVPPGPSRTMNEPL